jgi:serine protease AprX
VGASQTGTVWTGLIYDGSGGQVIPPSKISELRRLLALDTNAPTGTGVGVAIVDSGIARVPDVSDRIAYFYDFTRGGTAAEPHDAFGHGTHVAGLVAGSGALSSGRYQGVAPAARLIGLKVLDANGVGYVSDVINALEFATTNRAALGVDVINLSLGHPPYEPAASDPLVRAVEAAVRAGIVVVTSAGNYGRNAATGTVGYAGIFSPGNAPSAITAGSAEHKASVAPGDDPVAPYSSRGPSWYDGFAKPDVVAPGHQIVGPSVTGSTLATKYPKLLVPGTTGPADYIRLSGTSMAAAVTSGLVAVALEANRTAFSSSRPPLTPNAVKAILQYTAIVLRPKDGIPYDELTQGAGRVNGHGTVSLARAIDTSVPVESPWLFAPVEPFTVWTGLEFVWRQNVLWGNNILWGNSVGTHAQAWSTNIVWGGNILWGNALYLGDNIVWGNNILWSNSLDNIIWGNNVVWGSNILWGNTLDNIIWGNNILWGNSSDNLPEETYVPLPDDPLSVQ